MTPTTREQIETLKDLHARLTERVDWMAETEHLLAAARHFQGLTRRQFEAELAALQYPEDDAGMVADALAETARRGPRRLAAEYRRRAEDAASGRSARMRADLAAQVWAQIVELEAGGTGTPIKRRLGR